MDDVEIHVEGAPVIFSTLPPEPYNPLHRPEIHYGKPILAFVIWVVILGIVLCHWWFFCVPWAICVGIAWTVIWFAMLAKKALIWLVHLYQNKASDETRLKCVFEPSCSEYMILAVEKYGFLRGVVKGVRRLMRCHPPNGGKDYP